jgi:hypothetical protein
VLPQTRLDHYRVVGFATHARAGRATRAGSGRLRLHDD